MSALFALLRMFSADAIADYCILCDCRNISRVQMRGMQQ